MSKIVIFLLSIVFLFPVTSFSENCKELDELNVSCGSSSAAAMLLIAGGIGYLIYNSNAVQGMTDEEKAAFINDLNEGKGMKIKSFDSGASMYLLPNSHRIDERFKNNLNFTKSGFVTRPNILSLEYNF